MKKYLDTLISLPLFHEINADLLPDLLKELHAYTKQYQKDDYIRQAGDPADFIGVVLEGTIQIVRDDYYGNRNITSSFSKGSIFAEAFACAQVDALPVDILSCEKTVILFLPCTPLLHPDHTAFPGHDTLIKNLLFITAKKNILLTQKLQYVSRKTTKEKLMAYFNEQARLHQSPEFTIPYDRQGLADYLGVERSAMSAEISKLAKEGYIETRRSYFKLLRSLV